MRLTCLKCGHQLDVAIESSKEGSLNCVCGEEYVHPKIFATGVRPNARAAERSRERAFLAAGVVKNTGAFALGLSLLGLIFFPIGLIGAAVGTYTVVMVRGPKGRYSGRRSAIAALILGVGIFVVEGYFISSWWHDRQLQHLAAYQRGVGEDLRGLLRAERLYHATRDRYGSLKDVGFRPRYGGHTIFLSRTDHVVDEKSGLAMGELPPEVVPALGVDSFTAVAAANLDSDPVVDLWYLLHDGTIIHAIDDILVERIEDSDPVPAIMRPAASPDKDPEPIEPPADELKTKVKPKAKPKAEPKADEAEPEADDEAAEFEADDEAAEFEADDEADEAELETGADAVEADAVEAKAEPKADDAAEELEAEPKADDEVEELEAEPKADDEVEEPEAEPKAEDEAEELEAEPKADDEVEELEAEPKADDEVEEPEAESDSE
ncbi:hypothetical protein KAI87_05620 [Myxococcota bacterium]|nr:hypothetical protein [Myxococcota bacterium]